MLQIWNDLGAVGLASATVSIIAICRAAFAFRKKHWTEAALDLFVAALGAWVVFANTQQRINTHAEIATLQSQIAAMPKANVPRHLTGVLRSKLQDAAANNKADINVFLTANGHDADSAQYVDEIGAALSTGGMKVGGTSLFGVMPLAPLAVTYNGLTKARAFIDALQDALGPFPEQADSSVPTGLVKIWVNAQTASPPLP